MSIIASAAVRLLAINLVGKILESTSNGVLLLVIYLRLFGTVETVLSLFGVICLGIALLVTRESNRMTTKPLSILP
jgi:hypothetical protein